MRARPGPGLLATAAARQPDPQAECVRVGGATHRGPWQRGPELGRFVVVGGPGQGKHSWQFFANCTSAILKDQPRRGYRAATQDALDLFVAQCRAADLDSPCCPALPIRIVLVSVRLTAKPSRGDFSLCIRETA